MRGAGLWRQWLLLALCWLCSAAPGHGAGGSVRIWLVLSDGGRLYQSFAATLRQSLPPALPLSVVERAEDFTADGQAGDMIVTVGSKAAETVAGRTGLPLLAVMLPHRKYADLLARRPPGSQTSALYLDQPWARQAGLLRAALPEHSQIGVLYSPASRLDLNELRRQLALRGAQLFARQSGAPDRLAGDLDEVLAHSDVLLALPDSDIYNSNNIRNILLSSYHRGVPLVGFSQALVNAGGLIALFSTPEQLATQAGAAVAAFTQTRRLAEPQYPALYSIAVNQEVARTLRASLPSVDALRQQLDKSPGSLPDLSDRREPGGRSGAADQPQARQAARSPQ